MRSLFNVEPVLAPHKTKRFWMLVGLVVVAVIIGTLWQRIMGLSLRAQITSAIMTLTVAFTIFWVGVRFGRIAWFIMGLLMVAFIIWAAFYTRLHAAPRSNQSMKPTSPPRNNPNVIATTPCRGLSPSS